MEVGSGGQFSPSVRPHNPATKFRPPSQQWSLLNRFRMEQGHCDACKENGDLQTLIWVLVNGGLSQLHSADEDAILWLTSYGS